MTYHVVDTDMYFEDVEDAVDYCIQVDYHKGDDYFEEWVNDNYGHISIGYRNYSAYEIADQFGYLDELLDDYMEQQNDNDRENAVYELRRAGIGSVVECQVYEIEVVEAADEDGNEDVVHDENVDYVALAREYVEEQALLKQKKEEQEKQEENDLMKLFQVIS